MIHSTVAHVWGIILVMLLFSTLSHAGPAAYAVCQAACAAGCAVAGTAIGPGVGACYAACQSACALPSLALPEPSCTIM